MTGSSHRAERAPLEYFEEKHRRDRGRLAASLSLVAVALVATWMGCTSGGYFATDWTLATLTLAVLIAVGLVAGAFRGTRAKLSLIALTLFAAYTVWTFASILWSPNRGDAWLGADLTLLYLLALSVTVASIAMGASRRLALAASAIGPAAVAAFTVWNLVPRLGGFFEDNRLIGTVGYYNAEAAFLLVPFWTAIYLAGSSRVKPMVLRGLLLAGAVLTVDAAVLTQSRGAMLAMFASLPVFFLLSGQRLRGLLALAPVVVAQLIVFPSLNEVYLGLSNGADTTATLNRAAASVWFTTAGAGLYGFLWGLIDQRWNPSRVMTRLVGGIALVSVVAAVVIGSLLLTERTSDPVELAQQGWADFKGTGKVGDDRSRYLSVYGRGRDELWQIAWEDFTSHPILGVGTNNYEATYYQRREQTTTGSVRQPHMLPLEVLSERGAVGGVLLFGFLATCVIAGLSARFRHLTADGKAQIAALVAAVTYWLVHSSLEWFWQMPAVTLPAMVYLAMLAAPWHQDTTSPLGWPLRAAGICTAVLAIAAVAPLYIADRYLAQTYATTSPAEGLAIIERAQRVNPLDHWLFRREAELATRVGDQKRAEEAYLKSIRLNPEHYAPYALLAEFYEQEGQFNSALPLNQQALARNPHSPKLNRQAIRLLSQAAGESVTVRFVSENTVHALLEDLRVASPEGESSPQEAPAIPVGADGVLFAWSTNTSVRFSAQNMVDPLSMAFANGNGEIIAVESIDPSGKETARSPRPYRVMIVTRRHFFEVNGIRPRSRVVIVASS